MPTSDENRQRGNRKALSSRPESPPLFITGQETFVARRRQRCVWPLCNSPSDLNRISLPPSDRIRTSELVACCSHSMWRGRRHLGNWPSSYCRLRATLLLSPDCERGLQEATLKTLKLRVLLLSRPSDKSCYRPAAICACSKAAATTTETCKSRRRFVVVVTKLATELKWLDNKRNGPEESRRPKWWLSFSSVELSFARFELATETSRLRGGEIWPLAQEKRTCGFLARELVRPLDWPLFSALARASVWLACSSRLDAIRHHGHAARAAEIQRANGTRVWPSRLDFTTGRRGGSCTLQTPRVRSKLQHICIVPV